MRSRKRLYLCRDPNAMHLSWLDNNRLVPLHNMSIYQDQESLQSYVRAEVAPSVRSLLTRRNVTWEHLHFLLSKAHLRLEKGKLGGLYSPCHRPQHPVKASDVFRNNFAGKSTDKPPKPLSDHGDRLQYPLSRSLNIPFELLFVIAH